MTVSLAALGMVCALGGANGEIIRRALAGDSGGMSEWHGVLPEGAASPFGMAPLADDFAARFDCRCQALLAACAEQLRTPLDALKSRYPAERIGVALGTSNSTMEEFTQNRSRIDMSIPARFLRRWCGLSGPALTVSTACSSSAKVFATTRRLIATGVCDAVLVGGVDSYTRLVFCGFNSLEALSHAACDPLGVERGGINLGEGAAVFVMERDGGDVALLGVGESSDAYHLTAPKPDGSGAVAAMRSALADAGLEPAAVGYVNLHGTGTVYNDRMESAAVYEVFGAGPYCSSTKPMTGHTLGAAGAIEVGLCWLMLKSDGRLLPHLNRSPVDPQLPPLRLARIGDVCRVDAAISNSFAFGGSNASVIIGRPRCG